MRKLILTIAIVSTSLFSFASEKPNNKKQESYTINAKESSLKWLAKKVTGQHEGIINFEAGTITTEGNKLIGGEFTVNMTTLDATDLTGEYHDKLVGHLKSDDFFSVAKHNTSALTIKKATEIAGAKPGTLNYTITADLIIKGITNEITFPAMVVINKGKVIANAVFDVDRTMYDIKYGSGKFFESLGDKAIDDNFNVRIRIVANK